MTTEYVITQWEQGTIDAYGNNESSSTRVRMPNYIEVSSVSNVITTFIASAEDTNGTPLKINIMMYDSNHNVVYDNGWNDSGEVLDYTLNISYIRLILRYSDSRNIDPSDVGSCSVMYDNGFHWLMENNRLTNEYFLATPPKPFVGDSPYTFWRINPNANNGRPYQGLMIGVPVLASRIEEIVPLTYMQEKTKFFMMLLSPAKDTNYLYIVDENDYATLIRYLGNNTNIKVPKKIDGYIVKYIASTCYNYMENITSITIPDGIERIE